MGSLGDHWARELLDSGVHLQERYRLDVALSKLDKTTGITCVYS